MNNIIKKGTLCKHFKGKRLIDKNIYKIISLNNKGIDIDSSITYTGERNVKEANNLVIYMNIFNKKLFTRELDDFYEELDKEKQEEFGQMHRVEPLTKEEKKEIKTKKFVIEKSIMSINQKLKEYIEKEVFPEYDKNESGHGINHIKDVIKRSFELVEENKLDVNMDMVYVIAAYHDIGHHIDSKTHEIISADIMSKDKNLSKFFTEEELKTIKEAIEDHRASAKEDPRSIYGRIVSSADRNNKVEDCLRRTYTYGKKLKPDATDEELFVRAYGVLQDKFGEDGYAKFYFKDSQYENFLMELRELLKDKDKYISTQREYIKKLKKEKKI